MEEFQHSSTCTHSKTICWDNPTRGWGILWL